VRARSYGQYPSIVSEGHLGSRGAMATAKRSPISSIERVGVVCVSVPLIAALDSGWPAKFLGVVGLALFCAAMGIVELGLALVLYIISRFR
jgi:hypothetical protein